MNRIPLSPLAVLLTAAALLATSPESTAQQATSADPPAPTQAEPTDTPQAPITEAEDPYSAQSYVKPDRPGLEVGDPAPKLTLIDFDATEVPLASIYTERPLIIIFFRGGWCRVCARTIRNWQHIIEDVDQAGATLIAVTPQKQEYIDATVDTYEIEFPIFCDHTGRIARAFKVQNIVSEKDQKRFLERFDLDLSKVHAEGTWNVPAHAAFVIDTEGTIHYADATWQTMRAPDARTVLNAATDLQLAAPAPTPNPGADEPPPSQEEQAP